MPENRRSENMILGVMFRALGGFPSGWRYPGAHNNPLRDTAVLRKSAKQAEAAKLDFIFFGDWLSTEPDLENQNPYLLARTDPLSAIGYLAGITSRIGLIATAHTAYADPYLLARQLASVDHLSSGRVGLNLTTSAEPRAAGNFNRNLGSGSENRFERANEFTDALRLLWDSWENDAFVRDRADGVLIDPLKLHPTNFGGEHISVDGPLSVARPPQGHIPIIHSGTSVRSQQFVSERADISFAAHRSLKDALQFGTNMRELAAAAGRDPDFLKLITPILPVVAETTAAAQEIFDRLLSLVPLDDGTRPVRAVRLPAGRTLKALANTIGVAEKGLEAASLDSDVSERIAARVNEIGNRLIECVAERTGRVVGGKRAIRYRHLLAAHVAPAPVIVGDGETIANYFDTWFSSGAVDGFAVSSAFLGEQFDAFTTLVVPELRRRGLFRFEYSGRTLRDHLELAYPENGYVLDAETYAG